MTTPLRSPEISVAIPLSEPLPPDVEQLPLGHDVKTHFLVGPSLDSGWEHPASPLITDAEEYADDELPLRRQALATALGAMARHGYDPIQLTVIGQKGIYQIHQLASTHDLTGARLRTILFGVTDAD